MSNRLDSILSSPAESFGNDPAIEQIWTIRAVEAMNLHFSLISAVNPRELRLSRQDDIIYEKFRADFPTFPVDKIDLEQLKSSKAKEQWRPFCEFFKDKIEDYNFAMLLRLNSSDYYSESNTELVPRIQFLAIEIARNKEGFNDYIYKNNLKTPKDD